METGIVKFYNHSAKCGFITPSGGSKDVFFKESNVIGEMVSNGDQVEYEIGKGEKGDEAKNIRKVGS